MQECKGSYDLSIEKFVSLVQEYCAKKGPNHHVIFLVDEIGQYIADDTQLMLNLQTIVEDLGTACKGKAWVIVTSQEDIDSITKTKGNDFSKIQGRFDTRLSLSASNVDEVIRKRVLAKNETATQTLRLLYEQKESIIKNLITFTADTADKKLYADKADLQTAIRSYHISSIFWDRYLLPSEHMVLVESICLISHVLCLHCFRSRQSE